MDMIDGIPLSAAGPARKRPGLDREEVARRGAKLYMQMIFTHGFFHADPHPGNIVLLPGNVIGLLDFGMVGRIDERLRENIEDMLMAIVQHDVPLLVRIIKQIGQTPPQLDEAGLANDVADFVGHYSTQALDQFDVGGALTDMTQIMRRLRDHAAAQVAMLIKTLVTLEGTAKLLSPHFSLMEVMQPFHRGMLLRRLSPVRQAQKLRRLYMEVEQLVEVLPQRVDPDPGADAVRQVRRAPRPPRPGPQRQPPRPRHAGQRPVRRLVVPAELQGAAPALLPLRSRRRQRELVRHARHLAPRPRRLHPQPPHRPPPHLGHRQKRPPGPEGLEVAFRRIGVPPVRGMGLRRPSTGNCE